MIVLHFSMEEENIFHILMASVICLHFSMQEEDILERPQPFIAPKDPMGSLRKLGATFLLGATALHQKKNWMDLGDAYCNPTVVSE